LFVARRFDAIAALAIEGIGIEFKRLSADAASDGLRDALPEPGYATDQIGRFREALRRRPLHPESSPAKFGEQPKTAGCEQEPEMEKHTFNHAFYEPTG
jgi:hypothetical protein